MNRLEARIEKEKGPLPAPKEAAEVHTVKHAGYLGPRRFLKPADKKEINETGRPPYEYEPPPP